MSKKRRGAEKAEKGSAEPAPVAVVVEAPSEPELYLGDFTVGVTGHRKLGPNPRVAPYVHVRLVQLLEHLAALAKAQGAELVAVSALAIGADTLFAEAAVGLGIPLVGVVPFSDYPEDFDGPDRAKFETLLGLCRDVHRLRRRRRSDQAYLDAGKWVVDHTDVLVAVWNGQPAAGVGGTGDVVDYALELQRLVLKVDPAAAPGLSSTGFGKTRR
jgi:hypothetical protein